MLLSVVIAVVPRRVARVRLLMRVRLVERVRLVARVRRVVRLVRVVADAVEDSWPIVQEGNMIW